MKIRSIFFTGLILILIATASYGCKRVSPPQNEEILIPQTLPAQPETAPQVPSSLPAPQPPTEQTPATW